MSVDEFTLEDGLVLLRSGACSACRVSLNRSRAPGAQVDLASDWSRS